MFKKCLENRIVRHEGDYKCLLCHCEIKQTFDLVEEHLRTDKHTKRLNQIDDEKRKNESDILAEISESQLRLIVENRITFDRSSVVFYCHICKNIIGNLCHTFVHIRESSHRMGLKNFEEERKVKASKSKLCINDTDVQVATTKSLDSQATNSKLQSASNYTDTDEKTNFYYCIDCKSNITQPGIDLLHPTLESEFTDSTHNLKLECIIYDEKCNLYHCKICKCRIYGTANVFEHVQGFLHEKMLGTQSSLKMEEVQAASQEFTSQIIFEAQKPLKLEEIENSKSKTLLPSGSSSEPCFSDVCCCDTCQAVLENNAEVQYHVMLHLFKEFKVLNDFDILEFQLEADGGPHLKCLLCDFHGTPRMSDAHKFLKVHFETEQHIQRLRFFKFFEHNSKQENRNKQLNSIDFKEFTFSIVDDISHCFLCNICNKQIPSTSEHASQHLSGKSHKKKLNKIQDGASIKKKAAFDTKDLNYYKCFMCNESFNDTLILHDHYKTTEHKWKNNAIKTIKQCSYIKFQKLSNKETICCSLCNVIFQDFKSSLEHISGKKHNEKLKLTENNQENLKSIIKMPIVQLTGKLERLGVNPDEKLKKTHKKISNPNSSYATTKYSRKNKKPYPTLEPDVVANTLDSLVPLDFSNRQVRRLPSLAKVKPSYSSKDNSQKNTFATSVLLNGAHYIRLCIDQGPDNIYNSNHEKINLFKLGVNLTIPHHSDRVCFPCGQQFPDNLQSLFEHLHQKEHLDNLDEMLIEEKYFENSPDQFSHLRFAKLYMHASDQGIKCYACNVQLNDEDEIIRQHAKELVHQEKSKLWKQQSEQLFKQYLTIYKDIWYYAEVFFCEICQKRFEFEIDFAKHLIHPEHMKKKYELKCQEASLTFDLCPSCTTFWYGKSDSYEIHCQSDFHKLLAKSKDFKVPNITITASEFLDDIDKNVDNLETESNKVFLEKEKEESLLEAIGETVKPVYPNAEAYIFGSRLSHLGFPSSDVDVFLDCNDVYFACSSQEQSQEYIKSIESYFDRASNTWVVEEVLLATRVPIMKLRHIPTNLKCDISFINGLSVEKSKLVG